jgi:bacteriorhodopsin
MLNVKESVFLILLSASIVFALFMEKDRWFAIIPIITTITYAFLIKYPEYTQTIRFTELTLTLPLIVAAIHYSNGEGLTKILLSVLLILIAIGAGLAGNQTKNHSWFALAGLPLLAVLYDFMKMKDTRPVVYLLLVTWALYPLIWLFKTDGLINETQKEAIYSYIEPLSSIGVVDLLWMGF